MDQNAIQCPECDGRGDLPLFEHSRALAVVCVNCDGTGWLDEHGEPHEPEEPTKETINANK